MGHNVSHRQAASLFSDATVGQRATWSLEVWFPCGCPPRIRLLSEFPPGLTISRLLIRLRCGQCGGRESPVRVIADNGRVARSEHARVALRGQPLW